MLFNRSEKIVVPERHSKKKNLLCRHVHKYSFDGQNQSKEHYESRLKSFSKMKSGGIVLTIVGGIFTGVGTAFLVTAPDYTYDYYGFPTNEDEVTLHITVGWCV